MNKLCPLSQVLMLFVVRHRYRLLSLCILLLLCVAWGAEYILHIQPCAYCLYQRYVFGASMLLFLWPKKEYLGSILLFLGFCLALYHIGLEQHWWSDLLKRCDMHFLNSPNASAIDLRQAIRQAPIVRCDEVQWRIFNISATFWTALAYAFLFIISLFAHRSQSKV